MAADKPASGFRVRLFGRINGFQDQSDLEIKLEPTLAPMSLAAARKLPWLPGRSAEVFVDGDLEVRFTPRPSNGLLHTHERNELYIVASGSGHFCVGDKVTKIGSGDLLFAAAHVAHGFENFTDDFSVWIIFYGSAK
jgi:mannose-6-phosphate isomerase-like protein (cupin superfamily)